LSHLLEDATAPHRDFGIEIEMEVHGQGIEPVANRNPGLLYGLGNLIDNAVDFAKTKVRIVAEWTDDSVQISIIDDGPGFSPDVIDQLGEPYVTTRRSTPRTPVEQANVEHGGLGL